MKNSMDNKCCNRELNEQMLVIFDGKICTLKFAIDNCKPGFPIEGVHPKRHEELLKMFELKHNKKFTYSVDDKYGDWRFILFDVPPKGKVKLIYNPKYFTLPFEFPVVRPINIFK